MGATVVGYQRGSLEPGTGTGMVQTALRFTGERTGRGVLFDYDEARHRVAYVHALPLAGGRVVLDAGCGDGLGTVLLASAAAQVIGEDRDPAVVADCRERWSDLANVTFRLADVGAGADVDAPQGDVDLVCNFQVLEHVEDDLAFVRALRRRLRPGGVLLLTTPNVRRSVSENPYHVREYTADELQRLLEQVFDEVEVVGVHGSEAVEAFERRRADAVHRILRLDPLGLRRRLPRRLVTWAFPRLATLVRRRSVARNESFSVADFPVHAEAVDDALDLLARCRVAQADRQVGEDYQAPGRAAPTGVSSATRMG